MNLVNVGRKKTWIFRSVSLVINPYYLLVCTLLAALVIGLALWSLSLGSLRFGFMQIIDALFGLKPLETLQAHVLFNIRMPRTLTATLAGACFGISGALFQSLSKNPLGSPDVIGFTTGSATAALVAIIVFKLSSTAVIFCAFAGGLSVALVIYYLSQRAKTTQSGLSLILTGLAVSVFLTAFNSLLLVKGDLENAIHANIWLSGSLNVRTWQHVYPLLISSLLVIPLAMLVARPLRVMEMGDPIALQLGINIRYIRFAVVIIAVILSSAATAACGPIAFIALAAPRLFNSLSGNTQSVAILGSGLTGSILLLSADILTQLHPFSWTLPIGQVTGLLGGLYLLWALTTMEKKR